MNGNEVSVSIKIEEIFHQVSDCYLLKNSFPCRYIHKLNLSFVMKVNRRRSDRRLVGPQNRSGLDGEEE
jgi:hypothetical protein